MAALLLPKGMLCCYGPSLLTGHLLESGIIGFVLTHLNQIS